MKILSKTRLENVFNKLNETAEVFVPMQRGEQSGFYPWQTFAAGSDKLWLEALNVYLPPKNVVFPQTERMYNIKQEGQDVKIDETYEDSKSRVIFGARACDVKGITCMDDVFLTRGYEDSFYKARRQATTIIANACYAPGIACFCSAMGVKYVDPEGADIIIRDIGDGYVWETITEKGEMLTARIADLLEEREVTLPEPKPFQQDVNYDGVAEKLKGMFEHPLWDKLSQTCQNCGICTYVCPSCYCFDIQVKMYGNEGYRFRCWDSCMYEEYTREAGGGNPRPASKERFRNRFLHKLEFFKERYGHPLCTGCGRCTVVCPAGISIVKIIDAVKEADTDA
ncbi:MAG: 4Fe-4S dicluster domain-containing protein [Syntrophomonadaceae bacterium]|nr:4Fe-4S dicluster domain-containing protein [Syntrophomonadaceae bacterium]MDD4549804.1 4Fe-4S dicluster domain-containing protein [Syntrophomonadaceae bacterium]